MTPKPSPDEASPVLSLDRIVFFSDAVFAIAMTLLVLDLRLPESAPGMDNQGLLAALLGLWPKYLAYGISFLTIGVFWSSHLRRFHYIQRADRRLLFLNMLLLMGVAFIPFPTAVLSASGNRTATLFYALTILACGVLNVLILVHAARGRELVGSELTPLVYRRELLRAAVQTGIFLLSLPLAYLNPHLAKFLWLAMIPALVLIR